MRTRILIGLCVLAVAASGCGSGEAPVVKQDIKKAIAFIVPKSGSDVGGSAIFIREADGIVLQVSVESAPPGDHAVHIHEVGDCSADDATSAGGHWNPTVEDHGQWGEAPHHLGDIGNITVGEDGTGSLSLKTDRWAMGSGESNDIMGKSVIVHADVDDFETQPTGAAGGRIGCGVINAG